MRELAMALLCTLLGTGCVTTEELGHALDEVRAESAGADQTLSKTAARARKRLADADQTLRATQRDEIQRVDTLAMELATGKVVVNLSNKAAPSEEQLRAAIKESGFTIDRIEMP